MIGSVFLFLFFFFVFCFLDGDRGGHEDEEEGGIDGWVNFFSYLKKRENLPLPLLCACVR